MAPQTRRLRLFLPNIEGLVPLVVSIAAFVNAGNSLRPLPVISGERRYFYIIKLEV